LCGYTRSGKDAAAEALIERGWTRVAVSDTVLELAARINPPIRVGGEYQPFNRVLADRGYTAAKEIPAFLEVLQDVGIAVRGVLDPDAFVKATMKDLPDRAVFTSVRFPNEARAIVDAGGVIVRVVRPGVGPANDRATETSMVDWPVDATIVNDATPDALGWRLIEAVSALTDTEITTRVFSIT